jgi:hypothetical protein
MLIALWVRTWYSCDSIFGPVTDQRGFVMTSRQGGLSLGLITQSTTRWGLRSLPPETVPNLPYSTALGFGVCPSSPNGIVALRTPYWFLVLFTAMLAGVLVNQEPWRFSLRTLLVMMTFFAVLLGIFSAMANRRAQPPIHHGGWLIHRN